MSTPTPRQTELAERIEEMQTEIKGIEAEKNRTKPFIEEEVEVGCKECQEKLDAIPLADRKVTAVLAHETGSDKGGLLFFANGATGEEVAQFGIQALQATMTSLKDDEGARLMFSLRMAMIMKKEMENL